MPATPGTLDTLRVANTALRTENAELRTRLNRAEETLRAIRRGEIDALVVDAPAGPQIYARESAAAASNRLRGEALAHISDAVVTTDGEGRITFINAAAERQYGISAADVLGRPLDAAYRQSWANPPEEAQAMAALRETGFWRGELRHCTLGGQTLQVEASLVLIRDSAGQRVGLLAVLRDVTAQRELESALHASEAFIRGVLNSLADHVVVLDGTGIVCAINEPWERFARENGGLPAAIGPGANYLEVCRRGATTGDPYAQAALENLAAVIAGRTEECTLEYPCPGPSGTRWFLMHAGRARQGPPGVVVSHIDITARKQAELALAQASRQIEEANQLLERKVAERTARLEETVAELESFSYSISHDLRAPLRAIQSFSGLLHEECHDLLPTAAQDYLRRIISAGARMDRLIQDVLVFSRMSRIDLPLERIELSPFLRGLLEAFPQFSTGDAQIEMVAPLAAVRANAAALTQCLANLLGNAIKFVAPGVKPQIRIWTETTGNRVRLYLRDNGVGIAAQFQERIFEIFHQLDPRRGGTGVGLAVVRKAAERMGGRVTVASTPGAGSTFCLELDAPPAAA